MRWYFGLTESSFLKSRIIKSVFFYKRVVLAPNAKKFAQLDFDRNISIMDNTQPEGPKEIFTIHDIYVAGVNLRFSQNSEKLAFYDLTRGEIIVWDLTRKERDYFIKGKQPRFMNFSKDGQYLGVVMMNGVKFYDEKGLLISESKEIMYGFYLDFANNLNGEKKLVCIALDQKIIVWDFMTSLIEVKYEGHPEAEISTVHFYSSDSKIIASTSNQQIILWDYKKEIELKKLSSINLENSEKTDHILRRHEKEVIHALISPDEKYIFSYELQGGNPKVYVWGKTESNDDEPYDVLFNDFVLETTSSSETVVDNVFYFAGHDGKIYQYDFQNAPSPQKEKRKEKKIGLLGKRNKNLTFYSSDGKLLVKNLQTVVNIFQVSPLKFQNSLCLDKESPIYMVFSKNNQEIVIATKNELIIYQTGKSKEFTKRVSVSINLNVTLIKYLTDMILIVCGNKGEVTLWSSEKASLNKIASPQIQTEIPINVVSIKDKELFLTGNDKGDVVKWTFKNQCLTPEVHSKPEDFSKACINIRFFKKDPQQCLIGNAEGQFEIWSIIEKDQKPNTFKISIQAPGDDYKNFCMADFDISFDDKTLAAITSDGRVFIWSFRKRDVLRKYNLFIYEEKDQMKLELFFKPNSSNQLIAQSRESYKELTIDPELTELSHEGVVKAFTNERKLVSFLQNEESQQQENAIRFTDITTEEFQEFKLPKNEKEDFSFCFLSADQKRLVAYNGDSYVVLEIGKKVGAPVKRASRPPLMVSYKKKNQDLMYISDSVKGTIYQWSNDSEEPFGTKFPLEFKQDKQDFIHNAVKYLTALDLSYDDQKMLIETDNCQLILFDYDSKSQTWSMSSKTFQNNNRRIYFSMFSSKTNIIFSMMIINNIHQIVLWNVETGGPPLKTVPCDSEILKMKVEPTFDHLFLLSSKEQTNGEGDDIDSESNPNRKEQKIILELFSPQNEVFIQLTDYEQENPINFYYLNHSSELFICFRGIVKIFHDFYKNSQFLQNKRQKLKLILQFQGRKKPNLENKQLLNLKNTLFKMKTTEEEPSPKEDIITSVKMFPFNYNFLQILAYDQEDFHEYEDNIFQFMQSEDYANFEFGLFFEHDIHHRNCFDTAFHSRDTKIFKEFLLFILQKFKISELNSRYREFLDSEFFYKIFRMFEDHPIVCDFLDFVFAVPLEFPKNFMFPRMKNPLFITSDKPSLTQAQLFWKLKNQKKEPLSFLENPKNKSEDLKVMELVDAKCFYPKQFLDYANPATMEIFKLVSDFDPSNPIFENTAIIKILEHKWDLYGRRHYFFEAFMFLLFLVVYILNADFFFIGRIEAESDDQENKLICYSILSGFVDLVIYIFVFRLTWNEIKQLKHFGLHSYFNSFWNCNDILYITFSLLSTTLDLLSCCRWFSDFDLMKYLQSFTIFFAFFRLLSYARGIDGSSFMIKLIIKVIVDIKYFMILMILFIISLSCSVFVLQIDYSYSLPLTFDVFFREMLGDLSSLDDYGELVNSKPMLYAFFLLATLILYITMLNLLIAIISDTFNEVKKAEKRTRIWERWNIMTEIDVMLSLKDQTKAQTGYLIYIYNESQERESEQDQKKLENLLNSVDKKIKTNNLLFTFILNEFSEMKRNFENENRKLVSKLSKEFKEENKGLQIFQLDEGKKT